MFYGVKGKKNIKKSKNISNIIKCIEDFLSQDRNKPNIRVLKVISVFLFLIIPSYIVNHLHMSFLQCGPKDTNQ